MEKKYNENELENMADFISDYISEDECEMNIKNHFNCKDCANIKECCMLANDRCNSEWAESISYGGCDTEKEFWEQLFN